MNPERIKLEPSWKAALAEEFEQPYMLELRAFLAAELKAGKRIHPNPDEWFNAFNHTPLDKVRVVILGQDPYPTPGHAHGLCFSLQPEVRPLAKSLQNIFKELEDDLGIRNVCGSLIPWADQGVLLLNAVLTVESGRSNSHQGKGWERFTDRAVQILNAQPRPLVFVLWGRPAQQKGAHIDRARHRVLEAPHPSPLSAHRGFFGSKPFSQINTFLEQQHQMPIDWRT
ncbi:MAG TPA: uracil-DNA glycosylase [bacterium]|nr:uracil-DNA glycosylase [bacterium]